jgi:hypothetical protein
MVKRCSTEHELADGVGNRSEFPRAGAVHCLQNLGIATQQIDGNGIATLIGKEEPS